MEEQKNGVDTSAPPTPVVKKKLTREEMLEIENLTLKVQNIALQEHRLQQDLIQANGTRRAFQEEVKKKRIELSTKYGIDLSGPGVMITPEGDILEGAGTNGPIPPGFDHVLNTAPRN